RRLLRAVPPRALCPGAAVTPRTYAAPLPVALPICAQAADGAQLRPGVRRPARGGPAAVATGAVRADSPGAGRAGPARPAPGESRSEEHTSQLQSREKLVCRLLLARKTHESRSGGAT